MIAYLKRVAGSALFRVLRIFYQPGPRLDLSQFTAERILVVQGLRIGDTVATLPAIGALRGRWPDAQIVAVADPNEARLRAGLAWLGISPGVHTHAAELVSLAVADLEDLDAVQRRLGELEMLDDNLVSIPTNKFLTDSVASGNAGALHMMVVIDFLIAIDSDFATAKDLAYRATVTSKYVYLDKPVVVLLSDEVTEAGYATKVRIKAYVIDTRYEKRFVSDVTERVKRTYREAEITPPFLAYRREVS